MEVDEYLAALKACGGVQEVLPQRERWRLMQAWREVYAAPYHRRTGHWKHGQFDWHVFSFGETRALNAGKAENAYAEIQPRTVVVVPESQEFEAVRIELPHGRNRRPDFGAVYADVYIWPPDLSWTMAFTHEREMGQGPYFSRREWVS